MLAVRLMRCEKAGPAAEFAMVLPLLLLLLFGMIDVGRAMWTWNRAGKATEMGVRHAVTTDPLAPGLATYSYVTDGGLSQGAPIPEDEFDGVSCDSGGCTCKGTECPPLGTFSAAAFDDIVARMQSVMAEIEADNVEVDYDWSGLGYAGDPNGPDIAPLVTVRVVNLSFSPMVFFGGTLTMPEFEAALTMEDGAACISAYYNPGACT